MKNLQIELRDLSGKLCWNNDVTLEAGSHLLVIPAFAMPISGVYVWHLKAGEVLKSGKITKI